MSSNYLSNKIYEQLQEEVAAISYEVMMLQAAQADAAKNE